MSERPSGFGPMESTRPAELAGAASVPAPASAGAMLRQLRESAGVDLGVLASAMKVSQHKLEALEHDRFDQLPDVTFARALASAICRAFGVDPAPVLALMPASAPGLRAPASRLNEPFRPGKDGGSAPLSSAFSRPLLVGVAVLLLGAALLWLWPTWPIRLGAPEPAPSPALASNPAVQGAVVAPAEPAEPVEPAEAPPAVAPEPAAAAAPAPAALASVPAAMPLALAAPASASAPAPTPAAAASSAALSLSASGESWVSVHDANGKPLINRALQAGESVALDGALPLSVTIGRKDVVQAKVHGKPHDIRALGSGSVARFQVK